ncbi:uncharacterized protein IWZ02DRAFT_487545 [Phyllosticta citriasiana]|uniref:uncharacterized protein n=1 Tax=Phyllosticta citriasiana TaxID=595635 RepID=UPI0030FDA8C2
MLFFGLGGLFYVVILLTNAIAVLSEDRFLARSKAPRIRTPSLLGLALPLRLLPVSPQIVPSPDTFGWGLQAEPAFGGVQDTTSVKAKMIHLIASVRTLMRGKWPLADDERSLSAFWGCSRNRQAIVLLTDIFPYAAGPLIVVNTLIILYEIILG